MAVDFHFSYDHPQDQEHEHEHDHEQEELDDEEDEDDYIDMEVSSYYTNFLKSSPIYQPNEFEFRTQSGPLDRNQLSTTSPADELFYKGKLLPLHLPPRLHIMEALLHNHCPSIDSIHDPYSTPLSTTPATGTPFLSCNASPVESCHVSRELTPEEYFLEQDHASKKYSRSSKKYSSILASKIKASRAYIRLLFARKKTETAVIKDDDKVCHRRSFSGAFKLRAAGKVKTTTLSPSSSSGSSSCESSKEVRLLKRSNSDKSELESAVAGAIAHCKQSHSQSRKALSEIGVKICI